MSDEPDSRLLPILRAVAIGAFSSPDGVVVLRIECVPVGSNSPQDVQVHRYTFHPESLENIVQALEAAAAETMEMTRRDRGPTH